MAHEKNEFAYASSAKRKKGKMAGAALLATDVDDCLAYYNNLQATRSNSVK